SLGRDPLRPRPPTRPDRHRGGCPGGPPTGARTAMSTRAATAPAALAPAAATASLAGKALTVGLIGLALTALAALFAPGGAGVALSYLVGVTYWTAIAIGMLLMILIHHITDASWSVVLRRQWEHGLASFKW